MFSKANIPLEQVNLSLTSKTLLWGLNHDNHKMRKTMLDLVKATWNRLRASDREVIKVKIALLANSDPAKVKDTYVVREKAKSIFNSLY